jgi:hypothetical protein
VAPVAVDDSVTTQTNAAIQIPVAALIANDTDANSGEVLTVTAVGNAANGTVALDNGVVTFTPDQGFKGDATFDYTVEDSAGLTDTGLVTVSVSDLTVLFRINAAGDTIAALPGDPYGSDLEWVGGGAGSGTSPSGTQSGFAWSVSSTNTSTHDITGRDASVPAYVPQALFADERWDPEAAPDMQWTFGGGDLPAGFYTVNILAGNGFDGTSASGQRVFDIVVEDSLVDQNVDLSAEFGHQVGGLLSFVVEVNDGTLNVELGRNKGAGSSSVENPTINGIEILQGAVTPPDPSTPVLNILNATQTVIEGDTAFISIATNATVPQGQQVDFTYVIEGVTATPESDYSPDNSLNGSGTATFTGNATITGGSSDFQIPVDTLPDDLVEGSESFTVTITSVSSNATLGPNSVATVTIADDDLPPGTVIYRVNAGTATDVASGDGGPAWLGDANLLAGNLTGITLSGETGDTFTNELTNEETEIDLANLVSPVPWQLFINERSDNEATGATLDYAFDVTQGETYTVTIFYVENWNNIFTSPDPRIFDVSLEGSVPPAFEDIHPLREAVDVLDGAGAPLPTFGNAGSNDAAKQPYLGTAFSKSVTYTAADDELNLSFLHQSPNASQNPKVNAIQIALVDDATPAPAVLSIGAPNPATVEEDGDTDSTTLVFPVTFNTPPTGSVTVEYSVDIDGTATTGQTLNLSGDGSISVAVPNDEADNGPETVTVTLTAVTDGNATLTGGTVSAVGTVTEDDTDVEPPAPGTAIYRINSGGPKIVVGADDDSNPSDPDLDWAADQNPNPNPALVAGGGNTFGIGADVTIDATTAPTAPAAIFDNERWDPTSGAEMQYEFTVDPGTYTVNLYLVEGNGPTSAIGERVFDVVVEASVPAVFDDIDPAAISQSLYGAGAFNSAFVLSHTLEVTDGTLDLDFQRGVENPAIRGIEILSVGGSAYEPPFDNLFGTAVEIADTGDAPSGPVTLVQGSNVMSATQEGEGDGANGVRDRDYFTVEVPDGFQLTGVVLIGYENATSTAPDGFLAFQQGGEVTVDPATGANVGDLQGAIIYGTGQVGADLLDAMRLGFDDPQTNNTLPSFDQPLTGSWTFWLNQGAGPSTATLDFIVEPLPAEAVTLSIADAPTLAENGDTDPTTLEFPLTASDDTFSGMVTITFDQGAQTGLTQPVTFTAGAGTLSIDVPSDDEDNGDETVSITLTDADDGGATVLEIAPAADSATGVVTEDDGPDPNDIDGDGLANIVDPAFADSTNGLSTIVSPSNPIVLDFETPGADPFAAGFTGVNVNPDATVTTDATDPYGAFTSDGVAIGDGLLKITTSNGDSFNANNGSVDDYGVMFDARGNDSVSVKATLITPNDFTDANFQAWGIQIGDGTQESYVKFTRASGGQLQVRWDNNDAQVSQTNITTTAAQDGAARYDLEIKLDRVDADGWTLSAIGRAFDGVGQDAQQIGGDIVLATPLALTGDILAAINAGQLHAGVYSTDFNAPSFTAQWADFSVVSNDPPPANIPPTADAITLDAVAEGAGVVSFDLLLDANASDPDGGTPAIQSNSVSAVDGDDNPVAITLEGTSLSIDPAQFAAALDAGDSVTVTVSYTIVDGQGGETPNTATLVVNGEAGPFVWYLDQDQDDFGVNDPETNLIQTADPGVGYSDVAGDADDADATVFPGAPEINDGKDNDQDGQTDENNQAPTADAEGFDVNQNTTLSLAPAQLLDGDEDPDGDTLSILSVGNPQNGAVAIDPTTGAIEFTPDADFTGAASFEYTVGDGFGGEATATVTVNVVEPQLGGTTRVQAEDLELAGGFFAQNTTSADEGQVIRLQTNGSGSATLDVGDLLSPGVYVTRIAYYDESDGETQATLTLTGNGQTFTDDWVFDDDATSGNGVQFANIRVRSFAPFEVTEDTQLTLSAQANDGEFARFDYVEFQQVVDSGGQPPFSPSGVPDQVVDEEAAFSLSLANLFFDPDEEPLTFGIVSGPAWLAIDAATGVLSGTPDDADVGATDVEVSASDGASTVTETFSLTVNPVNDAPTTTGAPTQALSVNEPFSLSVAQFFADVDGPTLTYALAGDPPDGLTFDPSTGLLSGTPTEAGSFALEISASDGEFATPTALVLQVIADDPRTAVTLEAESFDLAGGFFVENQTSASSTAGVGKVIRLPGATSGEATFTFGPSIAPGLYDVRVTFFDENDGVATATLSAALSADGSFAELGAWSFDDPGPGDAAQAANLRARVFTGLDVQEGAVLKIAATSESGEYARIDKIELIPAVNPGNLSPQPLGIDDLSVGLGQIDVDLSATFSDPEEDALTYTLISGPTFLTISPDGVLGGAPTGAGVFDVIIGATDQTGSGVTVQQSFELTVVDDNAPPVVDLAIGAVTLPQGGTLERETGFSDPEGGPLTLSLGANAPDWVSIDADLGLLVGTPEPDDVGTTIFDVIATDPGGLSATDTVELTVTNVNDAPTAEPLADQSLTGGQAIAFSVPADAFDDPDLGVDPNETLTLTATLANGDPLPAWLAFDASTGAFSGTALPGQSLSLTVTATDAAGLTASATFALTTSDAVDDRDPILIEFEDFDGPTSAFFVANTNGASGGQIVRIRENDASGAISTQPFDVGATGFYTVTVRYIDETDGATPARLLIDGVEIASWSFDGVAGTQVNPGASTGNASQLGNFREITFDAPFEILPGTVLTVEVEKNEGEFARLDAITLTPAAAPVINTPPVFSTTALLADENQTAAGQVVATDADGDPVSYAIDGTGADDALFGISADGALTFNAPPDFEAPGDADDDGVYEVSVTATAGDDAVTQTVAVMVTDVNEAPTLTVTPVLTAIAEDADVTASTKVADIAVTDDALGANTLALTGDDAALFEIIDNAGTLELHLVAGATLDSAANPALDVTVTVDDPQIGVGVEASAAVSIAVSETGDPVGDQIVLRINAFGPEVAAIDGGVPWQADLKDDLSTPDNENNQYLNLVSTAAAQDRGDDQGFSGDETLIPASVPLAVLNTARSSNEPFSYDIPVEDIGGNGTFRINLYLAELFTGNQTAGDRIFDASVEGVTEGVLDNIDPSAPSGGGDLRVISYETTVSDGALNISFAQDEVDGVDNPIVNAIEVVRLGAPAVDAEGPTATIALTNPADANAPLLVDVTLADATGVDEATLGDADLLVPGGGAVTFLGFVGGVASYSVAAPAGGWLNGANVDVTLQAGAVEDTLDNPNLAISDQITLAIGTQATDGEALVTLNAGATNVLGTSTFSNGAIQIQNLSVNGVSIDQVIVDLSDTFILDTVFDTGNPPAGDSANKPFSLDGGSTISAGEITVSEADPFNNGNRDLILDFAPGSFATGGVLNFSIDIDPISATVGDIGGAVSGQELAGGTVTVVFSDGSRATSAIVPDGGSMGATASVAVGQENLGAPTLTLGDGTTAARVVNQANLPITIDAGVANGNGTARVYVMDTAFVNASNSDGNPDNDSPNPPGGPDAIQGNNAQAFATVINVQLDANGVFDGTIPVTRSTLQQANANGNLGFNYFAAGVVDSNGEVTQLSDTLVVEFDPAANVPPIGGGDPTGDVLLRINAFGPELAAADDGPDWSADTSASPSPFYASSQNRGDTDGSPAAPNLPDVPNAIFATARSDDAPFSYNIPVSALNGVQAGDTVTVNLYFAEASNSSALQSPTSRIFDVQIEGALAIDDFSPIASFGVDGGGVISTVVQVVGDELNINFLNNNVQNAIVSGIEIVAGGSDPINGGGTIDPPADPQDALEVLGVDDGVFDGTVQGQAVDGSNGGGSNGSVVLTVIDGNNTVDASNFGNDSFQLSNTGNKEVAAVFIDIRNAVFGDQVFDIDGTGGDTASSPFAIDDDSSGTGAFFVGADGVSGNNADNLFFPGPTPLADTSGQGSSNISGGYRGLLIRFDGSEGGFGAGETVGFSGDGDPNSIAGFNSGILNPNNVTSSNFDTGGQSGSELVGSSFTVLFADGTTATGYLGSDTTQAGAAGEAVQGRAERTATLSVDTAAGTFASGQTGAYGGTPPVITVSGNAGDVVRVVLHKGFQPTDLASGNPDSVAEVIQGRLDAGQPNFPVNNAFDVQAVDVTIGAGGTVQLPLNAFDYVNTKSGESFAGDDVQPIALTAAVVEQVSDTSAIVGGGLSDLVPVGPVSQPIYLTNQGGPVTGGGVDPIDGYFEGIDTGDGYRFKVQIEDENANGGQNPGGNWNFLNAPDSQDRQTGFQGDGYYLFGSNTSNAIVGAQQQNALVYTILIPDEEVGTFAFRGRFSRDGLSDSDQQNDLWLDFRKAGANESIGNYLIEGSNEPEPTSAGAIKIFGGPNNGTWGNATNWDGVPGNPATQLNITEGGLYEVIIYGRSQGLHVDYWELFRATNPGDGASNSPFVVTDPDAPQAPVISGGATASVVEGASVALDVDATDANGDTPTYSISGGADAGLFSIDGATGVVTFDTAPDFENPTDAGGDNVYNIQVTATDPGGLSDSQNYAITVTDDPSDNPVGGGPVLNFAVLDDDKSQIDNLLQAGDSYVLGDLGGSIEFTGTVSDGTIGSVLLEIENAAGTVVDSQVENITPYDITWDGASLAVGSYTLVATPFTGTNATGSQIGQQAIAFSITDGGGAASNETVTVLARGSGEVEDSPIFNVFADGQLIGSGMIATPTENMFQDAFETFVFNVVGPAPTSVDVVFTNDGSTAGGIDKNLSVDSVIFGGQTFESENDGFYDRVGSNTAFEGATENMYWNGTLSFDADQIG